MRRPKCLNRADGNRNAICLNRSLPTFQRKVNPRTCQKCPENVRLIRTLRGGGNAAPIMETGTPPERPQEPHAEPPVIRPDGTLIYPRTGWEAPPCPPGYRSKSSDQNSDDAWILVPLKPVCKHLELKVADIGACGYHRVAKRCLLIDSFIGAKTCDICEKRGE